MKTVLYLSLLTFGIIASCAPTGIQFPLDTQVVNENRYTLVIRETNRQPDKKMIMGPFDTTVAHMSITIDGTDEIIFPANTYDDLGDLNKNGAQLSFSPTSDFYVLSIPGGDGGESYNVHFGLSSGNVIWRRVGWTCADKRGQRVKTCFKDTQYLIAEQSASCNPLPAAEFR